MEGLSGAGRVGGVRVTGWAAPTLPPGPSEPSPSSAELALSRSLEREGRCLRPLASSWARALCKLLSSLTVSGTAKSRSANRAKGAETRCVRTACPEAPSSGHLHSHPRQSRHVSEGQAPGVQMNGTRPLAVSGEADTSAHGYGTPHRQGRTGPPWLAGSEEHRPGLGLKICVYHQVGETGICNAGK